MVMQLGTEPRFRDEAHAMRLAVWLWQTTGVPFVVVEESAGTEPWVVAHAGTGEVLVLYDRNTGKAVDKPTGSRLHWYVAFEIGYIGHTNTSQLNFQTFVDYIRKWVVDRNNQSSGSTTTE